jgi:hypothetical protein
MIFQNDKINLLKIKLILPSMVNMVKKKVSDNIIIAALLLFLFQVQVDCYFWKHVPTFEGKISEHCFYIKWGDIEKCDKEMDQST